MPESSAVPAPVPTPAQATTPAAQPLFLHDTDGADPRIDFLEYWRTLRKYKWAIFGFAAIVTLLAGVIAFVSTPIYEAQVTVLIETNKKRVVTIEDVYSGVGGTREYFQTQAEILKSREVALRTIQKLRLYDNPEYDPRAPKKGLSALLEQMGVVTEKPPTEWNDQTLAEAVLAGFRNTLTVEPVRLSQLVVVRYQSPDAQLAARVVNTLAQTYIENDLDARYEMTRTASLWLQERLSGLKKTLGDSEKALQDYRERHGLMALNKNSGSSNASQEVELLTSRLIEARTNRAQIEATYKIVKELADKGGDLASQPAVLNSGQVADAKGRLAEAQRKLAEVSQRYGKEHPKYKQAESERATAADNLRQQIDNVVGGIEHEYQRSMATERMLEKSLANAKGSVQSVNRKEFELSVYERDVQSNQQIYDMFMQRSKETNVAGDLQTTIARVVDEATVPLAPVKPKKTLIVGVALVLGLVLGGMLALLLEMLNNTLKTTEDVETRLKQPLLTVLPMLERAQASREVAGRMVLSQPNSLYAESIRTARTGVLLSSVDAQNRVIVVTSSVPGEGKTTFSSNLAQALALTKRTLLIDADMRRPSVAKAYGLPPLAPGLSNLVAGTATLSECLHAVEGSKLQVMPSGAIPPNPLELLHSERFDQTLATIARHFDAVIIDTPPVELVSDVLVIASHANGVIFLARAQSTPVPLARKALQRLRRADAQIIGVALNALDFSKAEKYYGEYSGYGKYGYRGYKSTYGGTYGGNYGQDRPKVA